MGQDKFMPKSQALSQLQNVPENDDQSSQKIVEDSVAGNNVDDQKQDEEMKEEESNRSQVDGPKSGGANSCPYQSPVASPVGQLANDQWN